ncbi:MAG: EamA family transporter [Burkholderiales bacterium]|nr:EamA family transporter [Burkholderiales bacterium]
MTNPAQANPSQRAGIYACVAARILWGGTAWYMAQSHSHDAFSLFYQRLLWAFAFCFLLSAASGALADVRRLVATRQALAVNLLAAALISTNWFAVFWCIMHHHVVEASFGFFIAPMLTTLLGLLVLREPLTTWTASALLLCLGGVLVMFAPAGQAGAWHAPWQVPLIAVTSTVYAFLRKRHPVPPMVGNLFETGAALVTWTVIGCSAGILANPLGETGDPLWYEAGIGVVTTVPMLLYVYSLRRTSLSLNAYLQYITPTVMFVLGMLVLGEAVVPAKLAGFALIWMAIVSYLVGMRRVQTPILAMAPRGQKA